MEVSEDKKRFWIVIRNTDQRYFKHFTKESAENEAKRLAQKEKGKFFVLESYLKVDDREKDLNYWKQRALKAENENNTTSWYKKVFENSTKFLESEAR